MIERDKLVHYYELEGDGWFVQDESCGTITFVRTAEVDGCEGTEFCVVDKTSKIVLMQDFLSA